MEMDGEVVTLEGKSDPNKRIRVPWMHMNEWTQVYEDVYSSDIKLQKRGYERMLLWKARQPKLPAGVECTLGLIHVHILDQEVSKQMAKGKRPTYADHDLQLMGITAIMRFLNHVSKFVQSTKDTLFTMASKLNIPNWLVELRHHGAHGSHLPTLSVMRMGVKFSLDWLKENYWEEAATVPGWVILQSNQSFSDKRIGKVLDVWQALKMYEMHGYKDLSEIPDHSLQDLVYKLINQKDDISVAKRKAFLLIDISEQVINKILSVIQQYHSRRGESVLDKLIAMLLESESFIPPAQLLNHEEETGLTQGSILRWLCTVWERFLVHLQERFGLFPSLVHKLLVLLNEERCQHRQLVMALWIRQLCISMYKSKHLIGRGNLKRSQKFMEGDQSKKRVKVLPQDLSAFSRDNPGLRMGFIAHVNDATANSCPLADVKLAVMCPNEFTLLFLPSLFNVSTPSIPDDSKDLLRELVSIYIKTEDLDLDSRCQEIYTVEDLFESKTGLSDTFSQSVSFTDFASQYEWATCPLGILPWQKDVPNDLEMPSHISWKLPKVVTKNSDGVQNIKQKKVDWICVKKTLNRDRVNKFKRKKLKLRAKKQLLASSQ